MNQKETKDLRIRILDEAAHLFNTQGIRFTMDDLARSLGISKKTIYVVFRDKRSIMMNTIDRFFHDATEEEAQILHDSSLSTEEKLRSVIALVPERYAEVDLTRLHVLKEKYPVVYRHWQQRREQYWKGAEQLLEEGIADGVFRPVSIPVFRLMFQATVEQFLQNDILVQNRISYRDALREISDILIGGIIVKDRPENSGKK